MNQLIRLVCLFAVCMFGVFSGGGQVSAQALLSEAEYVDIIQGKLRGVKEYTVPGGRVDILNETNAIEVEFAHKWKNAIGQAAWYGMQTNKKPGIVLILEKETDYRYSVQLQSALQYMDLQGKIDVWIYPNDFYQTDAAYQAQKIKQQEGNYERTVEATSELGQPPRFWLTISSKRRHNSSCIYFERTRGKNCAADEGVACNRCGG